MHDACARCWLAGMHVCARDGWKMRGASQTIVTVPFRKFHTPSTRALHPAHAPCGRARTPTTRAVLEFLSYLRGSPGEKNRILRLALQHAAHHSCAASCAALWLARPPRARRPATCPTTPRRRKDEKRPPTCATKQSARKEKVKPYLRPDNEP